MKNTYKYISSTLLVLFALFGIACGQSPQSIEHVGAIAQHLNKALTVVVPINAGQSNQLGADKLNPPANLPDVSIPFIVNDLHYNDGTHAFGPLDVWKHGLVYSHEISELRTLQAAGYRTAGIKIVKGATFINRWIPSCNASGCAAYFFYPQLAEAVGLLPAQFPDATTFVFLFNWDQGEEEARYNSLPTVQHWSEDFGSVWAGVQSTILGVMPNAVILPPYVMQTDSLITGKTFPGVLEGEQQSVTIASHIFNKTGYSKISDGVHLQGTSQTALGLVVGAQYVADLAPLFDTGTGGSSGSGGMAGSSGTSGSSSGSGGSSSCP